MIFAEVIDLEISKKLTCCFFFDIILTKAQSNNHYTYIYSKHIAAEWKDSQILPHSLYATRIPSINHHDYYQIVSAFCLDHFALLHSHCQYQPIHLYWDPNIRPLSDISLLNSFTYVGI